MKNEQELATFSIVTRVVHVVALSKKQFLSSIQVLLARLLSLFHYRIGFKLQSTKLQLVWTLNWMKQKIKIQKQTNKKSSS